MSRAIRRRNTAKYQKRQIRLAKAYRYDHYYVSSKRFRGKVKTRSFKTCHCAMCRNEKFYGVPIKYKRYKLIQPDLD